MIKAENLSVEFVYPAYKAKTITSKLLPILLRPGLQSPPKKFAALSGITFTVHEGDSLGILGPNGSGKSTLLRTIAGIYYPDNGYLSVTGKVSSLLTLGTGFDNNLSGMENIFLNGLTLGMSKPEIEEKIPEILEFSEIGDHINGPMKYYSNGMISRLSFSIVLALKPDILLIDEVFSVGDMEFQRKSDKAMKKLMEWAKCKVIVSHSMELIRKHCNKAIYMRGGAIVEQGSTESVIKRYSEDYSGD